MKPFIFLLALGGCAINHDDWQAYTGNVPLEEADSTCSKQRLDHVDSISTVAGDEHATQRILWARQAFEHCMQSHGWLRR